MDDEEEVEGEEEEQKSDDQKRRNKTKKKRKRGATVPGRVKVDKAIWDHFCNCQLFTDYFPICCSRINGKC